MGFFFKNNKGIEAYASNMVQYATQGLSCIDMKLKLQDCLNREKLSTKELSEAQEKGCKLLFDEIVRDKIITDIEYANFNTCINACDLLASEKKSNFINKLYSQYKKYKEKVHIQETGIIPIISPVCVNLIYNVNEVLHLDVVSVIYKKKTITTRVDYSGLSFSFKVCKGLRYRVGSVTPIRHTEEFLTIADQGRFFITNQRIGYIGKSKYFEVRIDQIVSINASEAGLSIFKKGRQSPFTISFVSTEEFETALLYIDILINQPLKNIARGLEIIAENMRKAIENRHSAENKEKNDNKYNPSTSFTPSQAIPIANTTSTFEVHSTTTRNTNTNVSTIEEAVSKDSEDTDDFIDSGAGVLDALKASLEIKAPSTEKNDSLPKKAKEKKLESKKTANKSISRRGPKEYKTAKIKIPKDNDFYAEDNIPFIIEVVEKILSIESPIEDRVLRKKLLDLWGFNKSSVKFISVYTEVMNKIDCSYTHDMYSTIFVWGKDVSPSSYNIYRASHDRSMAEIASEEIINAIFVSLRENGSSEREELQRDVAKRFFNRYTKNTENVISYAVEKALNNKIICILSNGKIGINKENK